MKSIRLSTLYFSQLTHILKVSAATLTKTATKITFAIAIGLIVSLAVNCQPVTAGDYDPLGNLYPNGVSYAFAYVELDYKGLNAIAANDINNHGDIIATYMIKGIPVTFLWDRSNALASIGPWRKLSITNNAGFIGTALDDGPIIITGYEPTQEIDVPAKAWVVEFDNSKYPYNVWATYIDNGQALNLNNQSTIVGNFKNANGNLFAWQLGNLPIELPMPEDWIPIAATGITNDPDNLCIAGTANDNQGHIWPVIWDNSTMSIIGNRPWNDLYVTGMNDKKWIIGYQDSRQKTSGIVWSWDGNYWNDAVEIPEMPYADDINIHNDVVGGHYLWGIQGPKPFEPVILDLMQMTALPAGTRSIQIFGINDNGEMVGIIEKLKTPDDTNGEIVKKAFILVPYDINNNNVPDYREILEDRGLDLNNNWVIDWAETFRTGLYSVGTSDEYKLNTVNNVQYVRLHFTQNDLKSLIDDEPGIRQAYSKTINDFGYKLSPNGTQRELLFNIRTQYPIDEAYDYVPPHDGFQGVNELSQEDILQNIRCLTYRVANHVDYIQFGNEFFNATGMYWFTNKLNWFVEGEYCDGPAKDVRPQYANDAMQEIFTWLKAQAQAAREGSALAGRPSIIIGPSIVAQALASAGNAKHWNSSESALRVALSFQYTNEYADIASVHMHYHKVEDLVPAMDFLANPDSWLYTEGFAPKRLACTEWGPYPSYGPGSWYESYGAEAAKYVLGKDQENPPTLMWQTFMRDTFLIGELGIGQEDMGAPYILERLSNLGLVCALFGNGYQTAPWEGSSFNVTAVKANLIHEDWFLNSNKTTKWNAPFKKAYENAAGMYIISPSEFGTIHQTIFPGFFSCQ